MHVGQQRFAAITIFRTLARSEVGYYRDPLWRVPRSLADRSAIRSAAADFLGAPHVVRLSVDPQGSWKCLKIRL
jgi:hypothetical protein